MAAKTIFLMFVAMMAFFLKYGSAQADAYTSGSILAPWGGGLGGGSYSYSHYPTSYNRHSNYYSPYGNYNNNHYGNYYGRNYYSNGYYGNNYNNYYGRYYGYGYYGYKK